MPILNYLWIIPTLPLLGSAINGLFGSKWPNKIINTVAVVHVSDRSVLE